MPFNLAMAGNGNLMAAASNGNMVILPPGAAAAAATSSHSAQFGGQYSLQHQPCQPFQQAFSNSGQPRRPNVMQQQQLYPPQGMIILLHKVQYFTAVVLKTVFL